MRNRGYEFFAQTARVRASCDVPLSVVQALISVIRSFQQGGPAKDPVLDRLHRNLLPVRREDLQFALPGGTEPATSIFSIFCRQGLSAFPERAGRTVRE